MKQSSSCWLPLFALAISACSGEDPGNPTLPSAQESAPASNAERYVVLYKDHALPTDAAQVIAAAGGTLVKAYPEIGVALAQSSSTSFREAVVKNSAVEGVSATSHLATQINLDSEPRKTVSSVTDSAASGDPLSPFQWNMNQIHAPEAHAINAGSPSVVAGVLDTGIDITHPDLATQVVASASVSCVTGVPDTDPALWANDFFGHGTHVAAIIAAAENGIGVVGVAPGARVAAIQVVNDSGLIFPEAFICGLTWAADHGMQLANASLFIDPWYFNCKNDPTQRAIWKAVQRAVSYAKSKGTTLIAATGNTADDLDHPTFDFASPSDGTPVTREITDACSVLPVEVNGVIGSSAVGPTQQLAFYSNFGLDGVEVTAPGGDMFVITPEAETGQVLSALPPDSLFYMFARDFWGTVHDDCSSGTCITYAGLQGTSQAAPHVTGVAALAISAHGKLSPGDLASLLQATATPLACPASPTACTGTADLNNFYGSGEVDALAVVE